MKNLKVSLLSFLTLFVFSFSCLSQEQLPDSTQLALKSKNTFNKAVGQIDALLFYTELQDSTEIKNFTEKLLSTPFDKLNSSETKEVVTRFDDYLKSTFQYALAIDFLNSRIRDARRNNDFECAAKFHQSIAPHFFYTFAYDSAEYHIDKALALFKELKNEKEIGELTIRKSGISYANGDYESAIDFAYKAIEIFKQTGNAEKLSVAYLQLGNIFYFLSDYQESIQYYNLSASAFKVNDNTEGYYRAISNIGLVKVILKEFRSSINLQLEAVDYFKNENKELEKGNAYRFLSAGYFGLELYDSAKYYNQLSMESNRLTKYEVGLGQGYLMQSKLLQQENKLKDALKAAKTSYKIGDSLQHFETLKEVSKVVSKIYATLGNIDSSYKYLSVYTNLNDSLDLNPEKLKDYAIKHQFQVEEAQFELLLAKEKAKIQAELNTKRQSQLIIAICVAVAALILLALAIIILVRNKKLSNQLSEQQSQIQNELRIKESLLNEIHHRVKNNLQVISSMLSLQTQYISDEHVQKVVSDCKSRINSMSLIHESLYKKNDGIEAPFSEYIQTLIPQLIQAYKIDKSKIKATMNLDKIHLNLDESIPCGLLINEIVSNALKHAFPHKNNGEINIKLSKNNGFIQLEISDNGVGFQEEIDIYKQETFGFLLIETLVKQLEAEMSFVNENGVKYDIKWKSIS